MNRLRAHGIAREHRSRAATSALSCVRRGWRGREAQGSANARHERKGLVRFLRCLDVLDREQGYAALNCGSAFDYLELGRVEAAVRERGLPTPAPASAPRPAPAPEEHDPSGPHPAVVLTVRIPEVAAPPTLAPPVAPAPRPPARSSIEPVAEGRWQWRIRLDGERKAKLDRLRGYLGHKIPDGDLERVFDQMLDDSLEKHGKRLGFVQPKRPRKPAPPKAPTPGKRARIPLPVRREVLKRDGYQCTQVGPDGERCPCTDKLEMDHLDPAKLTGSSKPEDLTTRCRVHNNYRARLRYGTDYVRRRMEEDRAARAARRAVKASSSGMPTLREPVARWRAGVSAAVA